MTKYVSPETKSVLDAVRASFGPPAFGLLTEVSDGAGSARLGRFADVLAMSLWPSRGLHLHGIEIKASRSDWLRELKNPAKADAIANYCDFWWVATIPDVVKDGELPATWGLLELDGDKLKTKVQAPPNGHMVPVDRSFLSAIFRRCVEQRAEVAEIETARQEGRQEEHRRHEYERRQHEELKNRVREFEAASGLEILHGWKLGTLGKTVKLLVDGAPHWHLSELRKQAQQIVDSIDSSELSKVLAEPVEIPELPTNGKRRRKPQQNV